MYSNLAQQFTGFLNTPPLWTKTQFGITQFEFPDVEFTHFTPAPIPQKIRLGHQMEHVCKQLLDASPAYEVLLYNEPVRQGKQTLGEIDYILRETATEQIIHLELTYKFYIIDPQISEPIHQLMGPNRRDMFFTKMEKIKNEQFGLLHSPAGQKTLAEKGIPTQNLHHQTCYKAQLFEPYQSKPINIRPLNPQCIVGYWLRLEDLRGAEFQAYEFYIPYKTEWVVAPHEDVAWMSQYETILEVNMRLLQQNAPILWIKKGPTTVEKCFVVWW
ncbi:DUF1853 family protein [Maribacter aurantiacus]|uniref:DUF1853 family protein n=1 Tax=Maribacter aurantiacus TaxID=1882343 RepID=A0A5R8M2U9_9FLAO|nr:DUF1853 family protein [Maribacter aurantiacus]TLF43991.1 DUF1853 family protein [Maribacter aurantiacus]